MDDNLQLVCELVKDANPGLSIVTLEIGARPLVDGVEPFYRLPELLPGSRIIGFELDKQLCSNMNADSAEGAVYYPYALGEISGKRTLYETVHPSCSSLYEPNEPLLRHYDKLEVMQLANTSIIDTTSLDRFIAVEGISDLDFVKIDVQGAELEIFRGGISALNKAVAIASEVEFVEFYKKQPLFGDVSAFLSTNSFIFYKFLGYGVNHFKGVPDRIAASAPGQYLWADAFFVLDNRAMGAAAGEKMLKLAVIACMYGCIELAAHCLGLYAASNGSEIDRVFARHAKVKRGN